jgi:hypothetical protein
MGIVEATTSGPGQTMSLKLMNAEGEVQELSDKAELHCKTCQNRVLLERMSSEEIEHARELFEKATFPLLPAT